MFKDNCKSVKRLLQVCSKTIANLCKEPQNNEQKGWGFGWKAQTDSFLQMLD